jgi:glycogen operon protein
MADLTAYNVKHNLGNGENNRDGTDNNLSFNHGVEGPTTDAVVIASRAKAMRNLLGTLLLSAGIPMLTAGDEFGRTQRGNNNAYCHDSELTWLPWEHSQWQDDLLAVSRELISLRRENPARKSGSKWIGFMRQPAGIVRFLRAVNWAAQRQRRRPADQR